MTTRARAILAATTLAGCTDAAPQDPPWTTMTSASAEVTGDETDDDSDDDDTTFGTSSSTSSSMTTEDPDTSTSDDTATTDADCTPPDPSPRWHAEHLDDIVAAMSGEAQLGGTTLPDRATPQRRALVAQWLLDQYAALGIAAAPHDYGTGTNIVATIPATGASAGTYVLGAHYDSVPGSPGANDNATGVALVTATARYLNELPCRTHDVLVVAFDEEEIGLVGSAAYADQLIADGTPIVSVHTIDQMGWDADGDRIIEIERPDPGLVAFYEDVLPLVPDVGGVTTTDTGSTDHVSFRDAGFAAVGITEEYASGDTTPHYHLPSDTYETVDFAYLRATSTLVNLAFASAIAGE
jgi:hypothetical protein